MKLGHSVLPSSHFSPCDYLVGSTCSPGKVLRFQTRGKWLTEEAINIKVDAVHQSLSIQYLAYPVPYLELSSTRVRLGSPFPQLLFLYNPAILATQVLLVSWSLGFLLSPPNCPHMAQSSLLVVLV